MLASILLCFFMPVTKNKKYPPGDGHLTYYIIVYYMLCIFSWIAIISRFRDVTHYHCNITNNNIVFALRRVGDSAWDHTVGGAPVLQHSCLLLHSQLDCVHVADERRKRAQVRFGRWLSWQIDKQFGRFVYRNVVPNARNHDDWNGSRRGLVDRGDPFWLNMKIPVLLRINVCTFLNRLLKIAGHCYVDEYMHISFNQ